MEPTDIEANHAKVLTELNTNDDKEFEDMEQEALAQGKPPLAERIRRAHAKYDARIANRKD